MCGHRRCIEYDISEKAQYDDFTLEYSSRECSQSTQRAHFSLERKSSALHLKAQCRLCHGSSWSHAAEAAPIPAALQPMPEPGRGEGGARTGGDAAADEDEDDGDEEQQPSNARGRGGGCAHTSEVVHAELRERFSKASCSPLDALGNSCRRGCLPSSQPRVDELDVLRSPSCGHRVHSSVAPVAQG